jgi:cathepsin D
MPSGQDAYAAIDTGTTLIGGPSEYIAAIFAQIPGSQAGTGNFQNYYTYRTPPLPLPIYARIRN